MKLQEATERIRIPNTVEEAADLRHTRRKTEEEAVQRGKLWSGVMRYKPEMLS